jgi:hypothetical protein
MKSEEMILGSALRTPRAAAIAGVVFAVLLIVILVLLRLAAQTEPVGSHAWVNNAKIAWVPRLVPFAGIAFLWLLGVARDRMGDHEDRFFATVFLGSGLLFTAMLFVASGIAAGVLADAAEAHTQASMETWELSQKIAAILLNSYAMRMAAVFMMSTATIGLRTRFMPRWLVFSGYLIATVLLLGIDLTRWVEVLFPIWVMLFSLDTLVVSLRGERTPALPAS